MKKMCLVRICSFSFIAILLLSLIGCGTSTRTARDGAPKVPPARLDKIPDAKPKFEPLSRYGNRFKNSNTYVERKRRYKVMNTSRGYKEKGLASWYGTKFHGRRTSSGEPYDMYAMTAAHRTLPLPTYARVTNLENGKSVIVKVNDRGPFHQNRLIDLSYVAAHKLGMLGRGTGRVHVESVDPRDHKGFVHHKKKAPLLARHSKRKREPDEYKEETVAPDTQKTAESLRTANTLRTADTLKTADALKTVGALKTVDTLRTADTPKSRAAKNDTRKSGTNQTESGALYVPNDKSTNTDVGIKSETKKGRYFVQMGSFNQKAKAEKLAKKLESLSNVPTYIKKSGGRENPIFRVQIGPVYNQQDALKLSKKLAQSKMAAPVVITD